MLVSIYIPEFDDAVEAGKLLSDFGTVWKLLQWREETGCSRRLDRREVVGLLPQKTIMAPIRAMAERSNVLVLDANKECLKRRLVETGESRTPRPEEPIIRMYYKLVRQFVLGLFRHRRRNLERPSRFIFGRFLTGVWLACIPDLWRLASPPPGLAGSRRSRFRRLERIHVRQLLFAT